MNSPELSPADKRLQTTFLISVAVLTGCAGLILAAGLSRIFPAALSPFVAAAALYHVDHCGRKLFSTLVANLLGLAALGVAAYTFTESNLQRLTAGTDLLVFLSWIVLGMQKTPRQYWWLAALAVLQVTTAGVLTTSVGFGAAVFLMSLIMIWTLAVFSLYRAALAHHQQFQTPDQDSQAGPAPVQSRSRRLRRFLRSFLGLAPKTKTAQTSPFAVTQVAVRNGLDRDPSEVWIGWRFSSAILGAWAVSILVGLLVFAAFPRIWVSSGIGLSDSAFASGGSGNRRTGFSGSVQLGQVGSLLQSNRLAASLRIRSLADRSSVPVEQLAAALQTDELRLRGVVYSSYNRGRWVPSSPESDLPRGNLPLPQITPLFEVEITAATPHERVVLAPCPVARVAAPRGRAVSLRSLSNSVTWASPATRAADKAPITYSVECPSLLLQPDAAFPFWSVDSRLPVSIQQQTLARLDRIARQTCLMANLSIRLPRLHQLARDLGRDRGRWLPESVRLRNVMQQLSSANGFRYTLDQPPRSFNLDPVETFLFETRAGHCEYFASTATLLLQAMNIPARLITGYSGCEWNAEKKQYEVLERHAHAWCEAWVGGRWITIDPTPSAERVLTRREIAERSLLSGFQAAIADFWQGSVNSMNAERQQALVQPLLQAARDAIERIRRQGIWPFLREFFIALFSPSSGRLTLTVAVAWIAIIAAVALLSKSLRSGAASRLLRSLRDRLSANRGKARSAIRFYSQFCELCEGGGLMLSPSATALELASAARIHFASHLENAGIPDLPNRIADAFNRVRFGRGLLSADEAAGIGADLQLFANSLQNSPQSSSS
jgi:hypothetical protein